MDFSFGFLNVVFLGWFAVLAAASFVVGKFLAPVLTFLLSMLVGRTKSTLDDRILAALTGPFESFFFIFVLYFGLISFPQFSGSVGFANTYVAAVVVVAVSYMAVCVEHAFFRWYYEEGYKTSKVKIEVSMLPFLQKFFSLIIYMAGLVAVMAYFGFDLSALLAITSVVSVVIGLASQETLGNIFAGLALQLDRPYTYGDYLKLPSGEVVRLKKIGIRSSKMVDSAGNEVILSNSEFAKLRVNRMGLAKKSAILSIPFEAPISLEPAAVAASVQKALESSKAEGLSTPLSVSVGVSKIKSPGWYEGAVSVSVTDLGFSSAVSSEVNGALLRLVSGAQKK